MISFAKIFTESIGYDADDYVPYESLKVGQIVRDNGDETFEILEIPGDNKLIVSLTDDPRDIRGMVYGQDCTAHASEQDMDDMEDDAIDEEMEEADPESILDSYEHVIVRGEGFDVSEIANGLREALSTQQESGYGRGAYLDIENTPGQNGVKVLRFDESNIDEIAETVEGSLKNGCVPAELSQHIRGWMMTATKYRPGLYPILDGKGVAMYKEAERKLSNDIHDFYRGSGNYTGD